MALHNIICRLIDLWNKLDEQYRSHVSLLCISVGVLVLHCSIFSGQQTQMGLSHLFFPFTLTSQSPFVTLVLSGLYLSPNNCGRPTRHIPNILRQPGVNEWSLHTELQFGVSCYIFIRKVCGSNCLTNNCL